MLQTLAKIVIAVLLVGSVQFYATAQEEEAGRDIHSIEEVTAQSEEFYGSIVTVEGKIEAIVSAQIFVLGEDAMIDDDQILMVNNTGEEFTPFMLQDSRVRVTGMVVPSYEEVLAEQEAEATPEVAMETTQEATMDGQQMEEIEDYTQIVYSGLLPEKYDTYTIIKVEAVEALPGTEEDAE